MDFKSSIKGLYGLGKYVVLSQLIHRCYQNQDISMEILKITRIKFHKLS